MKNWSDFDEFDEEICKYMPDRGEGFTKASQICTAVSKLVYKWFNDGDVYDNTYELEGWWNDLSDYANWLSKNTTTEASEILFGIESIWLDDQYTDLLYDLCKELIKEDYLKEQDGIGKVGSIYDCEGAFVFDDGSSDEEDEEDEEED